MSKADDCKVLFVDDESHALKYFRKAYETDFEILTAQSVDEAVAVLDEQGERIAVLITDQRMPKKTGTQLLSKVREEYPQIVRILTTAYSDLDSAIEAVNDGEIFRYITKPWDMRELRGTLLRAIDYSQIQRERDQLLCEKLSVMRRMAMLDYLRTLAVLIVGLEGRLRNAAQALEAYVNAVIAHQESERISMAAGWEDGWALGIEDSEQLVRHAKDIMKIAATDGQTSVNWAELLKHARSVGLETSDLTRESLPAIDADEAMLRSLFTASRAWLCQPTRSAAPRLSVAQIQTNGESGVQLTFAVAAKSDTDPGTHTFSPASSQRNTDLLIVFLIAHHFGGNVSLTSTQIKVILPTTPNSASATSSDDWIERLFTKLVG